MKAFLWGFIKSFSLDAVAFLVGQDDIGDKTLKTVSETDTKKSPDMEDYVVIPKKLNTNSRRAGNIEFIVFNIQWTIIDPQIFLVNK